MISGGIVCPTARIGKSTGPATVKPIKAKKGKR